MDKLQTENRELRGLREKLCRKERRTSELKRKNAELGEKYTSLLEDYEANQDQASGSLACRHQQTTRRDNLEFPTIS